MSNQIISFILFILSCIIICCIMLIGGWLLGQRTISRSKNIPFESGVISYDNKNIKLSIDFYFLAILFVIFDIETVYLYSWIVNIKYIGWGGFIEVIIFISILLLSLIYIIREKVFYWVPKKSMKIIY